MRNDPLPPVPSWARRCLVASPAAASSTPSSPISSIPEIWTLPRAPPRSDSALSPTSHSRRTATEPRRKTGSILVAGLLSDEFVFSTTPPSEQEIDQRTTSILNPSLSDAYRNLHHARAGAELAAEQLQKFAARSPTAPPTSPKC